jgi:hypothetical protein
MQASAEPGSGVQIRAQVSRAAVKGVDPRHRCLLDSERRVALMQVTSRASHYRPCTWPRAAAEG